MKINCRNCEKLLSPYIDGEISGKNRRRVEEHLRSCRVCRNELEALRATVRTIRGEGRETARELRSGSIWPLVRSELVREGKAPFSFRRRNRIRLWRRRKVWVGAGLAVAAAVFLVILSPIIRRPAEIYSSIARIESPEHSVLIYQDGKVVLIWLTEESI